MAIAFFVPGIPKAMSVGKSIAFKRGGSLHHFQKRNNTEWAVLVGQIGREHAPPAPLEGPVTFTAIFYLPRPQTASRKIVFPTKRPDIDNLVHKLTDFFNGVFWQDDSQIVDLIVQKRFAAARPGVAISVAPITLEAVQQELAHESRRA